MINNSGRRGVGYRVICAWCGVIIRHNSRKESAGMCSSCYARMFSEHMRPHQESGKGLKASDR